MEPGQGQVASPSTSVRERSAVSRAARTCAATYESARVSQPLPAVAVEVGQVNRAPEWREEDWHECLGSGLSRRVFRSVVGGVHLSRSDRFYYFFFFASAGRVFFYRWLSTSSEEEKSTAKKASDNRSGVRTCLRVGCVRKSN